MISITISRRDPKHGTLKYLESNLDEYKSDIALLSMVLEEMQRCITIDNLCQDLGLSIYTNTDPFKTELYKTILVAQQSNGSWANTSQSTLTKSPRSTKTTAYALVAIINPLCNK